MKKILIFSLAYYPDFVGGAEIAIKEITDRISKQEASFEALYGVFANENIKSGSLIYIPSSLLDVDITKEEFESLSPEEQKEVEYYGYFNHKIQQWHVAFDVIRMLNHSSNNEANVIQDEDMVMTAKKDISKGEELLQDYSEIYPLDGEHFNRIAKAK